MFIYSLVLLYILIYFCELVVVGLPQVQLYKSNSEHDIHICSSCAQGRPPFIGATSKETYAYIMKVDLSKNRQLYFKAKISDTFES